jgi:hypothetical protein
MSVFEINALLYMPGHPRSQLERALRIPPLSAGWRGSLEALLAQERSGGATISEFLEPSHPSPAWVTSTPETAKLSPCAAPPERAMQKSDISVVRVTSSAGWPQSPVRLPTPARQHKDVMLGYPSSGGQFEFLPMTDAVPRDVANAARQVGQVLRMGTADRNGLSGRKGVRNTCCSCGEIAWFAA